MNKDDTIAVIRSLLSSTKLPYTVVQLNVDFKIETGIDIPLFGYGNLTDFLNSIPDTVTVTGVFPVEKVSLVKNEKSGHIASLVSRQKNSKTKRANFFKHKPGHRKFPQGIAHRAGGSVPQKHHPKIKKPPEDVNFTKIPKEVSEKIPDKNEAGEVNHVTSVPPQNSKIDSAQSYLLEEEWDGRSTCSHSSKCVPLKNCVGPGENILHTNVELYAKVGEYVEVYPCQIVTPHKFYFHFRKWKKKFTEFKDKLQLFYATHNIPEVSDELLRPKLICAVFHKLYMEPVWHRAEIREVINGTHVKMYLIDQGVVIKVSKENLKCLHADFKSFPRQAYLGSLANIRPRRGESKWPREAVRRFYELSFRKELVAGVVEINAKNNSMKMALSFTKGSEIHINDTLVKEGFAEFHPGIRNISVTVNFDGDGKPTEKRVLAERGDEPAKREDTPNGVPAKKAETPVFYAQVNRSNNRRLLKLFSHGQQIPRLRGF